MFDQALKIGVKPIWIPWFSIYDLPINVHGVVILKWRVSSEHFIDQYAEGPPVDSLSMALIEENLRGNVFGCSTNGVGPLSNNFGKPKVNKFEVAISADHDVLWLQIPVDNILRLEILENGNDLSSVESRLLGVEVSNRSVMRKKISSGKKLGNEINVPLVLHKSIVVHLTLI